MSETAQKEILIIGGGVIGLSTGYFLSREGHRVRILDRDASRRESCSDQNAGMVVPSHFVPLAAPGVISQGLKWMLNPRSPFYLRPRLDPKLWAWCWQFFRHSTKRHVAESGPVLRDLSLASRALFQELSVELDFTLAERGLLMLCRTEEGLEEESEVVEPAAKLGIEAEVCDVSRLRELDPDVSMDVKGGVWFGQDCHLDPQKFLAALRSKIVENGGEFLDGEAVDFGVSGNRIANVKSSNDEQFDADEFVIAGGAWSPDIAKKIGVKLPMQGGKGYSFSLRNPRQLPRLCSLLKEGRVAVTPMGDHLRVAGTMEICGDDLSVNPVRLSGIVSSFCEFFPEFQPEDFDGIEPWSGLRPCSPDGLPYVGRISTLENATVNTGHSMLGLSLGPVSGKLVADLINGEKPEIEISKLAPERF